ncbi:hypothetical protein [Burkholderia gladioli]|uniref:hypothetical protein n=1 Tax=Burkholderia gladioli TaxID=28095 RepID=UPI0030194C2A
MSNNKNQPNPGSTEHKGVPTYDSDRSGVGKTDYSEINHSIEIVNTLPPPPPLPSRDNDNGNDKA